MRAYESMDAYRIVAADGGVRVLIPGGFATTALEEWHTDARVARAAIAAAVKDGMPASEVVDEATCPATTPRMISKFV